MVDSSVSSPKIIIAAAAAVKRPIINPIGLDLIAVPNALMATVNPPVAAVAPTSAPVNATVAVVCPTVATVFDTFAVVCATVALVVNNFLAARTPSAIVVAPIASVNKFCAF